MVFVRSPESEALPLSNTLVEEPIDISSDASGAVLSESVDPVLPINTVFLFEAL